MTADETRSFVGDMQDTKNEVVEIPFSVLLSPHLYGSFEDDKIGSIKYHLRRLVFYDRMWRKSVLNPSITISEIKFNEDKEAFVTKTPVLIYPNYASEIHNQPITKNSIKLWESTTSDTSLVTIDLSLSRSIWTSGSPIHITIDIQNNSTHTVSLHAYLVALLSQDRY